MKRLLSSVPALLLACVLLFAHEAAAVIVTFDEINTTTPVTVDLGGVTIGGLTIRYDGGGLGQASIGDLGPTVGNPLLLGDSIGLLQLDFAVPTPRISFNFGLNLTVTAPPDGFVVNNGVQAELFTPAGVLLGSYMAPAIYNDASGQTDGLFLYEGTAVSQALLLFDIVDSNAFTVDNIAFEPAFQPVPEPSTFLLLAAGLACAGVLRKRMAG